MGRIDRTPLVNMADQVVKTKEDLKAELDELVASYQKLTDPKERAAFFHAHPRLGEVYSALNHPPKQEAQ